MSSSAKAFLILGALLAAVAVLLGAFGAHALRGRLAADAMAVYRTAVEYHFYHSLGLLLIGSTALRIPDSAALAASGWTMCGGIVLFCGSLYVLAISGVRWFGAVTPLGGLAFVAGWLLFAWSVLRN